LFDPLIERLEDSRIHGGDHIDRCIQLFFRHARFPCVRKATLHSWIAEPHHRDGKTDEHLLPFGETLHGMSIPIKRPKVSFLQSFLL
jgi:hypothetical protein